MYNVKFYKVNYSLKTTGMVADPWYRTANFAPFQK